MIIRKINSFLNFMGIYLLWWGRIYEELGYIKVCLLWFIYINILYRSNFFRGYWFVVYKNLFEEIRRKRGVVFRVV